MINKRWFLIGGLALAMVLLVAGMLFTLPGGVQYATAKQDETTAIAEIWVDWTTDVTPVAPASGDSFDNLETWANKSYEFTGDVSGGGICYQNGYDDSITLAKALYGKYTNNVTMTNAAEAYLLDVSRYRQYPTVAGTGNDCHEVCVSKLSESDCTNNINPANKYREIFSIARNAQGFIVAADILGYTGPTSGPEKDNFLEWVEWVIPNSIDDNEGETYWAPETPGGRQILKCAQRGSGNAGAVCNASRMAGELYMRRYGSDTQQDAAKLMWDDALGTFLAYLGDIPEHPEWPSRQFDYNYFNESEETGVGVYWACDDVEDGEWPPTTAPTVTYPSPINHPNNLIWSEEQIPPDGATTSCLKTYTERVGHIDPWGELESPSSLQNGVWKNWMDAISFTVPYYDPVLYEIGGYFKEGDPDGATDVRFAIYTDDRANNQPDELVGYTEIVEIPQGTGLESWYWGDIVNGPITLTRSTPKTNWNYYWLVLHVGVEGTTPTERVMIRTDNTVTETGGTLKAWRSFSNGFPDPFPTVQAGNRKTWKHDMAARGLEDQTIYLGGAGISDVARCSRQYKPEYPEYPDLEKDYPFLGPICDEYGVDYPWEAFQGLMLQAWFTTKHEPSIEIEELSWNALDRYIDFQKNVVGNDPTGNDVPPFFGAWSMNPVLRSDPAWTSIYNDGSLTWDAGKSGGESCSSGLCFYDWLSCNSSYFSWPDPPGSCPSQ